MKRFWKEVAVVEQDGGWGIALDGRPVRTPGRVPLTVPGTRMAELIADEWRAVEDILDPRTMQATGLANAAVDRIGPDPAAFVATLAGYAETDLTCYRADGPEPLVERQAAAWDPVLDWARGRYDVHFEVTAGIVHVAQPPATVARLVDAVTACAPFELAPLSIVTTVTGSLVMALALANRAFDAEAIWRASQVDEDWQQEQWGEDELATGAREARHAEFTGAVRFLDAMDS